MWGYAIAAAKLGLKHQEFADFQVEPGGLSVGSQLRGFPTRYWLFHYTYQFEYMLDGTPCQPWTIGEYSLDKRHFSDEHPAYPLPTPPPKANPAAFYLLNAFNEAMGNISTWPRRQPEKGSGRRPMQTLYGRRRLDWFSRHANGFATELKTNTLVKELAGSQWQCKAGGDESELTLGANGDASGLKAGGSFFGRAGRWGRCAHRHVHMHVHAHANVHLHVHLQMGQVQVQVYRCRYRYRCSHTDRVNQSRPQPRTALHPV